MQPDTAIVSGEGVRLDLAPAGVASRTLAAGIDAAIQAMALILLISLDAAVAGTSDSDAFTAVLITEIVLVLAGYPIVLEWLARGRTVGKIALGLRAVRDDGGPIGLRQALTRGIAGLILEKPGLLFPITTVVGLITISTSARDKRLGDMLAGTVVLDERSAPAPLAPAPTWVTPPLQAWVLGLDLHRVDDRLALNLRQFVGRAHGMSPAGRDGLGSQLRDRLLAVTTPPPPIGAPTPDVLMAVVTERRRRAAAGTPGPWRAPAPTSSPAASFAGQSLVPPPAVGPGSGPFAAPS